jgi:hypothetical protein
MEKQININQHSGIVRFFAQIISFVFHPLFIPLYVTLFLVFVHPSYFAGYDSYNKLWLPLRIGYNTIFFPAFTVFLLYQLKFISSILLKSQKDRIIPYIACGIYYFWIYLVMRNNDEIPKILTGFLFGVFIASSAALIANIYLKVSMHAIGMGGLLGIFYLIFKSNTMLMTWPMSIAILITGIVYTARLIISDHQPKEIVVGLLIGIFTQIVAAFVAG